MHRPPIAIAAALLLLCGSAFALDPPLTNWPAPAFWTPPTPRATGHSSTASSKTGSVSTLAASGAPLPFIPMDPCRLVDTRQSPDTPYLDNGGAGETRTYHFNTTSYYSGTGACSLIPFAAALSLSVQFQVTDHQASLIAYPDDVTRPLVASVVAYNTGLFYMNSAIVPSGADGGIKVFAQWGGQVVININGYYSGTPGSGLGFYLKANDNGPAILGENSSTTCLGICGVAGQSNSTQPNSFGVGGRIYSTALDSAGTYGTDLTGVNNPTTYFYSAGVRGEGQNGVVGISSTLFGYGVVGEYLNGSGGEEALGVLGNGLYLSGVYGETFSTAKGSAGVVGEALATTGQTYGVWSKSASSDVDAAGVYGQTSGASGASNLLQAGVRGDSDLHLGVLGASQYLAVGGRLVNSSGNLLAEGLLGYASGVHNYGVYSNGDFGGTGAKYFIEPHPLRADQTIRYVALEGPEAGTYFRGKGRFVGRSAVIEVPEDFRLVTDPEALSIQVTPIGELATVAVVSIGLDEIVLKSSRDVEFFFTVNGVRHTHKDLKPILDESAFMPEGPNATIPGYLTAAQKQSLIANGTYNADGTVNMQTAARVGWTKVWHDREEANKASAEKAAAQRAAQSGGQGQPGQRP